MSEKIDKIIKSLKNHPEGRSATSIANEIGFSKASSIIADLEAMVKDGSIVAETGARFTVYKLVAKVQKVESNEKTSVIASHPDAADTSLPELGTNELSGYSISSVKKDGKTMKKIVCPDGKKILLGNDEKLVVINNEPKYVVKTAQEIIACIQKYSSDNGLNVFTVNDIKQNRKISTEKDLMVNDNHIISLKIQKHNKAAK